MASCSTSEEKTNHMAVSVRVRPMNESEREHSEQVICCLQKSVTIRCGAEKTINFDNVFHETESQETVFRKAVVPLINQVLLGFSSTVICYGTTGSGKTFTLIGGNLNEMEAPEHGMILRAYKSLKNNLQNETNYNITVSSLEIYNEEIYDLLRNEGPTKLKIYNVDSNVIIQGLTELSVTSDIQFLNTLQNSVKNRKTAVTQLNSNSSRSHSIFTITVSVNEVSMIGQTINRTGKLKFVDLAGSENISKSCVVDKGFRESSLINRSLLSLGMVINSLASRSKKNFICFRESKLTRLLEDSLGGTAQTLMIANISPAKVSLEETKITLAYAENAKKIICNPKKDLKFSDQASLEMIKKENKRLKRRLECYEKKVGVFTPNEEYTKQQEEYQNLKKENAMLSTNLNLSQQHAEQYKARIATLLKELDLRDVTQNIFKNKINTMRESCASQRVQIENYLNMKYQHMVSIFNETIHFYENAHSSHHDVLDHLSQTVSNVNSQIMDLSRECQMIKRSTIDLVEDMEVKNKLMFSDYSELSESMEIIEKHMKKANTIIKRRKLFLEPEKRYQEVVISEVENDNANCSRREEHVFQEMCSTSEKYEPSQAHSSARVKFLEQASKLESLSEKIAAQGNTMSMVLDHIKQRQNNITFSRGKELIQETNNRVLEEIREMSQNINHFFLRLIEPSGDTPDFKRRPQS